MPENEKTDVNSEYKKVNDMFAQISSHYTPSKYRTIVRVNENGEKQEKAPEFKVDASPEFVEHVTQYTPVTKKTLGGAVAILLLVFAVIFGIWAVPEILYREDYDNAVNLYKSGQYGSAVEILEDLGNFKDSPELCYEIKYKWALSYFNQKQYKNAMELFGEVKEYSDGEDYFNESTYRYAGELFANAEYDEATELYESILNYKDVSVLLEDTVYQNAFSAFLEGNYERAIKLFGALENNEEAKQMAIISKAYIMDKAGNADPDEISTVMANLGVIDTEIARLALQLDVFTYEKLSGSWQSTDGVYSLAVDRTERTIKIVMPIGYTGTEFKIEDNIIYVKEGEDWLGCLLIERFEPDDVSQPDSVTLYNYYDEKVYTLYK